MREAFRNRIAASFDEASDTLLADGMVAEARLLQGLRERLIEVVENTPKEDGMSSMEWVALFARKSGAAMGTPQSTAASPAAIMERRRR